MVHRHMWFIAVASGAGALVAAAVLPLDVEPVGLVVLSVLGLRVSSTVDSDWLLTVAGALCVVYRARWPGTRTRRSARDGWTSWSTSC